MNVKELTYQDIVKLRKQMQENNRNFYEQPIVITYQQAIQIENECLALEQENEKLKKALFITYMKTVDLELLKDCFELKDYNNRVNFFKELTQQEYELLKEVINNE